ncbi:MAG: D-alanine--D-alanine ligase [Proteobacteria bacterium]|nr:D-alanine--D-alanine ligase [Pseudomonadota bacterium]MBU4469714.1 D-alanine--D-alanine ligase [Pseudomonadota bacterium]MCG2751795.1 D-alanine--D-alanine ligase [Desulfobacteraceae bacterium]
MKIGLTYDLRSEYLAMGYSMDETAEFDRDDTISALETALSRLGHKTDRIGNAQALIKRLSSGDRWDLVFNIAEGLHGIGREAQVPAILDIYEIPYTFSDPMVMSLTLHKAMTKRVIRDAGLATTDFFLVHAIAEMKNIHFDPPYFIKPVAEGTGKGTSSKSIVQDKRALEKTCKILLDTYKQAVLVEPYLPGREFTTGVVGTGEASRILGTMEIHLLETAEQGVYSHTNKEHFEDRVRYTLAKSKDDPLIEEVESLVLASWKALECRDGGRMDIRCDGKGKPMFMEVNPLAGLHPQHSDLPILCGLLDIPYLTLIETILNSAMLRIKK